MFFGESVGSLLIVMRIWVGNGRLIGVCVCVCSINSVIMFIVEIYLLSVLVNVDFV